MLHGFIERFSSLEDPRYAGFVTYPLMEILLGGLVGTLCGGEDWEEIALICEEKLSVLRKFLPYANGLASVHTFERVFDAIEAQAFSQAFGEWMSGIAGAVRGVVAVDGKTLRGARQKSNADRALHVLSAFAHEAGVAIGQCAVNGKSNEITAIPLLLETLDIEGGIVTIDAMGTQTAIAQAIRNRKADYVLALKGNQGTLHDDVRLYFTDAVLNRACATHETTDANHGRIEHRLCRVSEDIAWLKERHPDWADLRSIIAITATRTCKKTGESSVETRYYISSLPPDPAALLANVRAHWSIENNLHWMLDILWREDQCRTRKPNAALNLAAIRKITLALLKRCPEKIPVKRKIKKAALNDDFLLSILS